MLPLSGLSIFVFILTPFTSPFQRCSLANKSSNFVKRRRFDNSMHFLATTLNNKTCETKNVRGKPDFANISKEMELNKQPEPLLTKVNCAILITCSLGGNSKNAFLPRANSFQKKLISFVGY